MRLLKFNIVLIIIPLFYVGICTYLWANQKHYIYEPTRAITTTPADYQLSFKDVYIPVSDQMFAGKKDGDTIHGWWIPSDERDPKALLYLHGSAFNISANVEHVNRLVNMGFSVLIIDYRGYGMSDGRFPSEETVYADAEAAWKYLTEKMAFLPNEIIIYGHSLGGAVGIHLALRHPDAAGLIVESTFTSILDVAVSRNRYRMFPLGLIVNQKFDSITKIEALKVPILYIHGVKDEAVPTHMAKRLYNRTRAPKRILLVPDGTHNNNAGIDEMRYINAVREFLRYASDDRSDHA